MAGIKTINKYFLPVTKDEKEIIDLRSLNSSRIAKTVSIENANAISRASPSAAVKSTSNTPLPHFRCTF